MLYARRLTPFLRAQLGSTRSSPVTQLHAVHRNYSPLRRTGLRRTVRRLRNAPARLSHLSSSLAWIVRRRSQSFPLALSLSPSFSLQATYRPRHTSVIVLPVVVTNTAARRYPPKSPPSHASWYARSLLNPSGLVDAVVVRCDCAQWPRIRSASCGCVADAAAFPRRTRLRDTHFGDHGGRCAGTEPSVATAARHVVRSRNQPERVRKELAQGNTS